MVLLPFYPVSEVTCLEELCYTGIHQITAIGNGEIREATASSVGCSFPPLPLFARPGAIDLSSEEEDRVLKAFSDTSPGLSQSLQICRRSPPCWKRLSLANNE